MPKLNLGTLVVENQQELTDLLDLMNRIDDPAEMKDYWNKIHAKVRAAHIRSGYMRDHTIETIRDLENVIQSLRDTLGQIHECAADVERIVSLVDKARSESPGWHPSLDVAEMSLMELKVKLKP